MSHRKKEEKVKCEVPHAHGTSVIWNILYEVRRLENSFHRSVATC